MKSRCVLTASWAGAGPTGDAWRAALTSTRVVDLDDPGTWGEVNLSFPVAAQLPG